MATGSTAQQITQGTATPTVTLVGGAGNTTPVYTTNTCRYTRTGNRVFADILLSGDGGAEGAGTGQINVALPINPNASRADINFVAGAYQNGAISGADVIGNLLTSTIALYYRNADTTIAAMTGADQNNTSRYIHLKFDYEV